MKIIEVILEALNFWPGPKDDPPASRVGESEMERKSRNFWWIAGWVICGLGFAFYLNY